MSISAPTLTKAEQFILDEWKHSVSKVAADRDPMTQGLVRDAYHSAVQSFRRSPGPDRKRVFPTRMALTILRRWDQDHTLFIYQIANLHGYDLPTCKKLVYRLSQEGYIYFEGNGKNPQHYLTEKGKAAI